MTFELKEISGYAGFAEALALIRAGTGRLSTQEIPLSGSPGYVSAEDARSLVTSPQQDSSLKDGFAVRSEDVLGADPDGMIELSLVGSVFAGGKFEGRVESGQTVKILSGAPLPEGADAVVSSEFCDESAGKVRFRAGAEEGRNVIRAGEDAQTGDAVMASGQLVTPARLAYAATAGLSSLKVFRKPRIAVISIGDELVEPGRRLDEGQIYASNAVGIRAWLSMLGISHAAATVRDDRAAIRGALKEAVAGVDAIVTIGGAMHSERDLIGSVLEDLDARTLFRHIRMGPGKGTSFRTWDGVPVFCLSGGPSSCMVGFVALALPGICNMMGLSETHFSVSARLRRDVPGRQFDWTEFSEARLVREGGGVLSVVPCPRTSRVGSMANADCLLCKPEGVEALRQGEAAVVLLLSPLLPMIAGGILA
jgi:molybdopterin molybdotransferase